jgi:hypothetical protein
MAKPRKVEVIGDICLYDGPRCGFGYLAHLGALSRDTKLFGDGDPHPLWGGTEAMWHGLKDLQEAGANFGLIRIFAPDGKRMAQVRIDGPWRYYGDLSWEQAPVYEIAYEAIMAAAEKD